MVSNAGHEARAKSNETPVGLHSCCVYISRRKEKNTTDDEDDDDGGDEEEEGEEETQTGGLLKIKTCPANAFIAGSLLSASFFFSFSFRQSRPILSLSVSSPPVARIGIFFQTYYTQAKRSRFDFVAVAPGTHWDAAGARDSFENQRHGLFNLQTGQTFTYEERNCEIFVNLVQRPSTSSFVVVSGLIPWLNATGNERRNKTRLREKLHFLISRDQAVLKLRTRDI